MSVPVSNNHQAEALRMPPALGVIATILALGLAAGCAKRDSITVGAVPDDYRTNHPIVISEQSDVLDVPVGMDQGAITTAQRVSVEGFIANYDRSASSMVTIMVPHGSANEAIAAGVASDIAQLIRKSGVPQYRVATVAYSAQPGSAAPIRVSYNVMKASTGKCGRWPADLTDNADNRHYANFGCSYQNNLAAQIANPADLLGPRKPGDIDAERRGIIIEDYRNAPTWIDAPRREINY
jgi:pilus assembly protein CpaD